MPNLARKRMLVVDAQTKMVVVDTQSEAAADEQQSSAIDAQENHRPEELRVLEALLFAAAEPLDEKTLATRLPDEIDVGAGLRRLQADYAARGVNLVCVGGRWTFRTANDLAWLLSKESVEPKKLSRAALETLAIIAYHQPVTRADIEEIRGVTTSKGTLDVLMETGWIRMRGRRRAPGRPVTYGVTEAFLTHFGLDSVSDLPGVEDLKAAGLLDSRVPEGFSIPEPRLGEGLAEDEDPLEEGDNGAPLETVVDTPSGEG